LGTQARGPRNKARKLLVSEAVNGDSLFLVLRREFHGPQGFHFGWNRRVEIKNLLDLVREFYLGGVEEIVSQEEAERLHQDRSLSHVTPHRRPVGLIRRRRIVPRKDCANPDQGVEKTKLGIGIDRERNGVLQPLATLGTFRDVERREAGHSLVNPRRAMV